ncbi:MAG: ABC transporter permease [bacterium]|nr:ABC transporter permease [bacterium]
MKHFYNIVKKEVAELVTKQLIISLVFMVLFFVSMGKITKSVEEGSKEIRISILNLDVNPYLQNILSIANKQGIQIDFVESKDVKSAIKEAREQKSNILLVLPDGFSTKVGKMEKVEIEIYSIMNGLSMQEAISSKVIESIIETLNNSITTSFIQKEMPDKKPEDILNPIHTKNFVILKEKTIPGDAGVLSALVMSQSMMIPLVIMMVIMYTGMLVMTSMGTEKENKTLETLLTLPVKREYIIAGKMVGSAVVGFLMTVIYMVGFKYYMSPFTSSPEMSTSLKDLGLFITPFGYVLLGISLFLAIIAALSMCIILGVFAQDTKSAMTMTYPIMLVVFIPFFLSMFKDIETLPLSLRILVYAIPFTHPMIASKSLIFHDYRMVLFGIAYMIVFVVIAMWIAVRLFNTDKVLTAKFSVKWKK